MYVLESGIEFPEDHKKAEICKTDLSGKSYKFGAAQFYIPRATMATCQEPEGHA